MTSSPRPINSLPLEGPQPSCFLHPEPHTRGQFQYEEPATVSWTLGRRALGRLSSHLPTLPSTRSDTDTAGKVVCSHGKMFCRTRRERSGVSSLAPPWGRGTLTPPASLLPLVGKARQNPVSMATTGSPVPSGCLQRSPGFKNYLP